MEKQVITRLTKNFEECAYEKDGIEFWFARDLQLLLGYVEWRKFQGVIEKAKESCNNSGNNITDHFVDADKMVKITPNR
jgi:DNA-damage-inducible protein D